MFSRCVQVPPMEFFPKSRMARQSNWKHKNSLTFTSQEIVSMPNVPTACPASDTRSRDFVQLWQHKWNSHRKLVSLWQKKKNAKEEEIPGCVHFHLALQQTPRMRLPPSGEFQPQLALDDSWRVWSKNLVQNFVEHDQHMHWFLQSCHLKMVQNRKSFLRR